jgi:hypothetical protein
VQHRNSQTLCAAKTKEKKKKNQRHYKHIETRNYKLSPTGFRNKKITNKKNERKKRYVPSC